MTNEERRIAITLAKGCLKLNTESMRPDYVNSLTKSLIEDYIKPLANNCLDLIKQTRWIPVEERLPETRGDGASDLIRLYNANTKIQRGEGIYKDGKFWTIGSNAFAGLKRVEFEATHWMLNSNPPLEGE